LSKVANETIQWAISLGMMDKTPLPAMLEIQAVTVTDPVAVAEAMRGQLGRPLRMRQLSLGAAILLMVCSAALLAWRVLHPAPWEFTGVVEDVNRAGFGCDNRGGEYSGAAYGCHGSIRQVRSSTAGAKGSSARSAVVTLGVSERRKKLSDRQGA
jgi:hypothetical protein